MPGTDRLESIVYLFPGPQVFWQIQVENHELARLVSDQTKRFGVARSDVCYEMVFAQLTGEECSEWRIARDN
jgi:hypothetical protein